MYRRTSQIQQHCRRLLQRPRSPQGRREKQPLFDTSRDLQAGQRTRGIVEILDFKPELLKHRQVEIAQRNRLPIGSREAPEEAVAIMRNWMYSGD